MTIKVFKGNFILELYYGHDRQHLSLTLYDNDDNSIWDVPSFMRTDAVSHNIKNVCTILGLIYSL